MKYQVFGILWTVFNLALMLVMGIVGIYLLWLVIKALRVYINSHEVREEKKATRKSLAEALRENRVRCKMTQEFVSETIGVSRQAVSKWENGTSDPNTSNLIALAKLYGISAEELLKSVCVSSGNDAAVALAEKVSGVTELFVEQMNNRAKGLGMDDTHFVNCTGLTAKGHVTSAYDIALMSRELLTKHPDIRHFTTIWMDTIRDGTFGLANTNKLIRFYDGATGLKTGYTSSAGYCISATAEREGMELIAVIMKGETADKRNTDAKALLNYGFSTYALVSAAPEEPLPVLPVSMGETEQVPLMLPEEGVTALVEKGRASALTRRIDLPEGLTAPVAAGQPVGTLTLLDGETEVLTVPILAAEDVPRRSWGSLFVQLLRTVSFAR